MTYPVLDTKKTGENIRAMRIQRHLRVEDISEFMGFESTQAVYKWQRGDSLPTLDNLYALSRLFQTPMDSIVVPVREEREEDESPLLPFYNRACIIRSA